MNRRRLGLLGLLSVLAFCVSGQTAQRVLYEKESRYNTIVVTEDDDGLRTMLFETNGARQSVVKVGDPDHVELAYARTMLAGLAFAEPPKRVLIVGLGGGTIPSFLHKHYPKATIDVVDIDPVVVEVAKKFFGFREDAMMHAHVKDGRKFIEQCKKPYDLIFLDAFGAESIPYHLATQEFLQAVRRALAPNGVVLANVWSRGSNRLYDSMIRTYQSVFDVLDVLDVRGGGNKILIGLPVRRPIKRSDLARRAAGISKEKHLRFDMGELVKYGYRRPERTDPRGRILKDKPKAALQAAEDQHLEQ